MLDMDTGQIVIEDTILAACELWLGVSVSQTETVKMLAGAFKPEEAKTALEKLKADGLVENVQKHNKGEKYYEDLIKLTGALSSEDKLPKIVVVSSDIFRIPRPTLYSLDNVAVGARMNVMEKKFEDMDKNVAELLKNFKEMISSHGVPKSFLSPDVSQVGEGGAAGGGAAKGGRQAGYAHTAGAGLGRGRSPKRSFQEMEETPSANNSDKVNDGRDGENEARDWKDVKKKQRKINYGKAKVTTGRSDVAVAPYEVFIANTHPESTAELIKEILIECASDDASRDSPLEVIDVKCMMNREKIPNPRTLCWKVTVPNREREYMMKD